MRYRIDFFKELWVKTFKIFSAMSDVEVKAFVILGQRDVSEQTGSRRICLLKNMKYNFALCWLVLLSVTISAAAEVSSLNHFQFTKNNYTLVEYFRALIIWLWCLFLMTNLYFLFCEKIPLLPAITEYFTPHWSPFIKWPGSSVFKGK